VAAIRFRSFFAKAMGAGSSGELFNQTRDYIAGFSIGAPGSMGALVLVPFLQMAGQSNLLIAAVLTVILTVSVNLINRKNFLLPLEIFSYNPWLIAGFVLLLFGMAWLVLHITFRRFRSGTWYELIMAARDLL
jgi:hypothetical protein